MVFRKSFQSRSTPMFKGRDNLAFNQAERGQSNEDYHKRIRNHLISQLSVSGNELMERWPGSVSLNRLMGRKLSIQEEYEETNLVLVNVKNLPKRDFYAENRAKLDLENYLPDLVIQWQADAKDKSYKEILGDLAQQVGLI